MTVEISLVEKFIGYVTNLFERKLKINIKLLTFN